MNDGDVGGEAGEYEGKGVGDGCRKGWGQAIWQQAVEVGCCLGEAAPVSERGDVELVVAEGKAAEPERRLELVE